ncbi:MAG: hypothetical protein WAS21_04010 [Geminicoccaceae bacterium]
MDSIKRLDDARSALFAAIGSQAEQTKLEPGTLATINLNLSVTCNALDNWRTTTSTLAEAIWDYELVRQISNNRVENQKDEFELCYDFDAGMPTQDLIIKLHNLRVVDVPTQKAFQRAGHYREAIGQFLLPLLYGLLGASASFARSLSTALRDVSYSPSFWVDSFFLIPLGALAGATVGIVIAPDTLGTGWGITTLGFSFLLGYSVDGFFARLDSMMRGLANASATRPEMATDNAVVVSHSEAPIANGGKRPPPPGSDQIPRP